jgi:hypothetical protein
MARVSTPSLYEDASWNEASPLGLDLLLRARRAVPRMMADVGITVAADCAIGSVFEPGSSQLLL